MIARFVEKLGPKVVILHEQANEGRTVIEKFEDHADVPFAIVLMTGDDRGGLNGDDIAKQQRRARQNVIFELGYFLAKLGRRYVAVVHEENVELPSDYSGVVYLPLDAAGAWRWGLAREIRAAGLEIDLNNAL
jgi:predicted nucleotide-binding protein